MSDTELYMPKMRNTIVSGQRGGGFKNIKPLAVALDAHGLIPSDFGKKILKNMPLESERNIYQSSG